MLGKECISSPSSWIVADGNVDPADAEAKFELRQKVQDSEPQGHRVYICLMPGNSKTSVRCQTSGKLVLVCDSALEGKIHVCVPCVGRRIKIMNTIIVNELIDKAPDEQ